MTKAEGNSFRKILHETSDKLFVCIKRPEILNQASEVVKKWRHARGLGGDTDWKMKNEQARPFQIKLQYVKDKTLLSRSYATAIAQPICNIYEDIYKLVFLH